MKQIGLPKLAVPGCIVSPRTTQDAFHVRGKPVTIGLFGVPRPQDPATPRGPGLRIIMNCIP
eukprot:8733097-Karenia_brevis.AAC.1